MPDEQSEEAEAWMTEVQEKFNDATNRKIKYVEQITLKEDQHVRTRSFKNTLTKHEQEGTQRAQFSKLRTKVFRTRCNRRKFLILH